MLERKKEDKGEKRQDRQHSLPPSSIKLPMPPVKPPKEPPKNNN